MSRARPSASPRLPQQQQPERGDSSDDDAASSRSHAPASPLPSHASAPDLTSDMSDALEQVGWGPFQAGTLLPITGLTLMADAMELMLLPFLTLGVECE